jgi:hypothetical protein
MFYAVLEVLSHAGVLRLKHAGVLKLLKKLIIAAPCNLEVGFKMGENFKPLTLRCKCNEEVTILGACFRSSKRVPSEEKSGVEKGERTATQLNT